MSIKGIWLCDHQSIQVCATTIPQKENIKNYPRQPNVGADQSEKGYEATSK